MARMHKNSRVVPLIMATLSGVMIVLPTTPATAQTALQRAKTAAESAISVGYAGAPAPDLPSLVGNFIRIFLSLLGIIFLGLTVYGGFLWMTAAGKEDQIDKAKDTLRAAVIGIIITLAAYAISNFVISNLLKATGAQ